ncbi:MAG: flagellar basal body P-ring formation chaperone FlgA [Candidatus Thiodiazotropha endolucinida]
MYSVKAILAVGLLLVAGIVDAGRTQTGAIEISLRDQVRLQDRTFTLGDIAQLDGTDSRLVSRLKRVLLGRTPRAGVSAQIGRDAVASRIDRLSPGISKRVTWKGAAQTRVQAQHHRYDRQAYLDAAQRHLDNWLGKRYKDFSAKPVGSYADLQLPAGKVAIQAEVARRDRVSKRMCVWVDLLIDEAHYTTLPVWFDVTSKAEVYELQRDLSAGTSLKPHMLKKSKRDLAAVSGEPVAALAVIEGQRLIRDLPSGTVLTKAALQPVPDVIRGQKLQVKASVGKVTLIATARALEDGNRGDPIRVERLDGSDNYMARVLDTGLAVVEEDYR